MNGQSPDDHAEACVTAPSNVDVVDAFVECLSLSTPDEREMMILYLRSKVCIECGTLDPDCNCWEESSQAVPS